jgi:hypothetical protein
VGFGLTTLGEHLICQLSFQLELFTVCNTNENSRSRHEKHKSKAYNLSVKIVFVQKMLGAFSFLKYKF